VLYILITNLIRDYILYYKTQEIIICY